MQRIAATGILRGRGANVGWENQSWFDAEATIAEDELRRGLHALYPACAPDGPAEPVSGRRLAALLGEALGTELSDGLHRRAEALVPSYDPARPLTRLECAQLIDAVADPFHRIDIDIHGNLKKTDTL